MRKREKKREVKAVNTKGKLGSYKYLKKKTVRGAVTGCSKEDHINETMEKMK